MPEESEFVKVMRENLHEFVQEYIDSYADSWPTSQESVDREKSDRTGRGEDFMHYLANNIVPVNRDKDVSSVFWFEVKLHAARISDGKACDPWTGELID